ncbi:MAG TPA: aminoacyl-tRNA hydrolase [Beijerinckiaceae bacterium]|jgi:PTH1 family peptidyl-tRNA hydrolase|nr:aminoacyl-tRNA hydrolase [Beijerinckiaceae bacterium]
MQLFAGLGNPGREYAGNRHNIGFMAIDAIARRHSFPPFRKRFLAETTEGAVGNEKVLLVKPQTFMNESGQALAQAARFYKLTLADINVLHDELDLAPSKLRVKTGGGNAGHNGLRSISAHLGNDYRRIRLGIGHPGDKALVYNYVLSDFARSELPWVEALCDIAADNIGLIVQGDEAAFQNKVHLAMAAAGFENPKVPGEPK